jgi:molybdopterin-guanine dinucleotide biosynthesis protein A
MSSDVTAVVLCGGSSQRFGGDKLGASIAGRTVLDSLLSGVPATWDVVCVGPRRETPRPVTWTREHPHGSGPLSAVGAGVAEVLSLVTVVVAGDMPFAGTSLERLVATLDTAPDDIAAVVATDADGYANPLLAAYRTDSLRAAIPDDPQGRPARTLLGLAHDELAVTSHQAADVDTRADLDRLRRETAY